MDPHLLPYAERQAPRYTSYPSAPHFSADVDGALYQSWLGAIPENAALSLYLHIPYCKQLCWYCGCNTYLTRGRDIPDFVTTLMTEIDLVASAVGSHNVSEIHWGGGTPNILSPREFLRLQHHIAFWFDLAPALSHSIELDPRHVTRALVATYAQAGVNRASLGLQDLNPHVQMAMGRVQPYAQVVEAVAMLREAGMHDLSFDLMYGLPQQTDHDIASTIRLATDLAPNRIALFGYAHAPWLKRRQRMIDTDALPNAAARFEQAELARAILRDLGYESIGLDHFAKPDDALAKAVRARTLHRNFQGYVPSNAGALIGFGPSAISRLTAGYTQNIPAVRTWQRIVESGRLPIMRGHTQSADDTRREAIIEALMCDLAVDLASFGGQAAFPEAMKALAPLAQDGLVEINGDVVRVPPNMRPFCRLVASAFDAYANSETQHSEAI
ncbi:MAG: oxygen-independent coproporphyrinogen III oxidase [Caulobacterales bacterium]|nr:oxygen-independent coproporphyrinogen III oxidase [Caulobacterales bacterium]